MIKKWIFACWALLTCVLLSPLLAENEEENLILSQPDQVNALTTTQDLLVEGFLSPLTGHPRLKIVDLTAKGAEPITISRTYVSPFMPESFDKDKDADTYYLNRYIKESYRGWEFFPHLLLSVKESFMWHGILGVEVLGHEVRFTSPSGVTLDFNVSKDKFTSLAHKPFGMSNYGPGGPSGKHDPRNTRIYNEDDWRNIIVFSPDGTVFHYQFSFFSFDSTAYYNLVKEVRPHGKVLRYSYTPSRKLAHIESCDLNEQSFYAAADVSSLSSTRVNKISTSSGLEASYKYDIRRAKGKFKKEGSSTSYDFPFKPLLKEAKTPYYSQETINTNPRFLLDHCSLQKKSFSCSYQGYKKDKEKIPHYRINTLFLPVGSNDTLEPIYQLNYDIPIAGKKTGSTTVKHCDGTKTVYHYSKSLLLEAIRDYDERGILKREKCFQFDHKQRLKSIELKGEEQNLLSSKSYSYDRFGNPILETIQGNLTGKENESYTIKRQFSQDGRHLLLKEELEEGPTHIYSYLPKTNLVTAHLVKDQEKILQRTFFLYDECCNLLQKITDDGCTQEIEDLTHVTQRQITEYTLRQAPPFLHMPEWIEEKYLDNGAIHTLKKTHLAYDNYGNVCQEEIYDAEGNLAYTLNKEYNARGDLLFETNALGQKASYSYDEKGRCISSLNFSNKVQTEKLYDARDRLCEKKETSTEGRVHLTTYHYDLKDHLKETIDHFNNKTVYDYDPLTHKVTKKQAPSLILNAHPLPVITAFTYDSFGRQTSKTDPNGNSTFFHYNIYGKPTCVIYPDGTQESYTYTKRGKLKTHIDKDNNKKEYIYDPLDRLLSITYFSSDQQQLAKETYTYNAFHLIEKQDKEENKTVYSYDSAGRKISEECSGKVTELSYDPLGFIATITKHNLEATLVTHFKRDLLGRVLEKTQTDLSGKILHKVGYVYDEDGNQTEILRTIEGKETREQLIYDSFGRIIEKQDALGVVTKILYDESHCDALGQGILKTVTTDPHNNTTVCIYNPQGQIVKKEKQSSNQEPLSLQEKSYDPNGNLLEKKDDLYLNGEEQGRQTISYSYTSQNQLATFTRAFGTPNARTTTFTYTPSGKVSSKTLPDGTTLSYIYNPLGYLESLTSSCGQIQHHFTYNRKGQLLKAEDLVQGISIKRKLDPFGNCLQECFSTGVTVEKTYDLFDRPLSLHLLNNETIHYTYDPLFLKTLEHTSSCQQLYIHHFNSYDLSGNLLQESPLNTTYHYDELGQKKEIICPYFCEQYTYDMTGNLITKKTDHELNHYTYDELHQLTSEKGQNYSYDSLYNRKEKNGEKSEHNSLNELLSQEGRSYAYDLNGNLIRKDGYHFSFDPLNQLKEAYTEEQCLRFTYDPLGRRLTKTVLAKTANGWQEREKEHYFYDGYQEIGAFTPDNQIKNLRFLNPKTKRTVAVKLKEHCFATISDQQGNIRRLIDPHSKTIAGLYEYSAFGEPKRIWEAHFNPWHFASKRFDEELNLINFGKRTYDPELACWLTLDPAGSTDSINLYQYVFNNPFKYTDPDGQFVIVIPLIWAGVTWAEIAYTAATVAAISTAAYGGYKVAEYYNSDAMNRALDAACFDSYDYAYLSKKREEESKRHTPDQEALKDLVKETTNQGHKPLSSEDAKTVDEWAKETDYPGYRASPADLEGSHWENGPHIHMEGPAKSDHIPVEPGTEL